MKEYKFSEAVEMLTNDKMLKFEDGTNILKINGSFLISINKFNGEYLCNFTVDMLQAKYTLVKQPVSYIEALQAFAKGKVIEVEKVDNKTKQPRNHVLNSDMHNFEFCLDDIQHGIWYILD